MFVHFRKNRANIPNLKNNQGDRESRPRFTQTELEPAGCPVLVDTVTIILNIDDMNSIFLVKEVENFYAIFAINAFVNGKGVQSLHTLDNKGARTVSILMMKIKGRKKSLHP